MTDPRPSSAVPSASSASPRVSLGVPLYNAEAYLEETLDSLLAQTFTDFEIIISDNASTDATEAICRRYAALDDRIRYVRHATNLGAAANFNVVLEMARAPYYRWVCYDDPVMPTMLEDCVAILDAEPDVIAAAPRSLPIDQDGVPDLADNYFRTLTLRSDDPSDRLRGFFREYRWGGCGSQFYSVFRVDPLRATVGLDPYPSSDIIMLAELSLRGQFQQTKGRLFCKRIHKNSSVAANDYDPEKIVEWFDPNSKGVTYWLESLWLSRFIGMIARVPMRPAQRLRCYRVLYEEWVAYHGRRLAKEWWVRAVEAATLGRRKAVQQAIGFGTHYRFQ